MWPRLTRGLRDSRPFREGFRKSTAHLVPGLVPGICAAYEGYHIRPMRIDADYSREIALHVSRGLLLGFVSSFIACYVFLVSTAAVPFLSACVAKTADPQFEMEAFGPAQLARAVEEDGAVNVSWTQVAFATGYTVYRRLGDGPWTAVADLDGAEQLGYSDTAELESGAVYTYAVDSFSGQLRGGLSNTIEVRIPDLATPSISLSREGGILSLHWGLVSRATAYQVEYAPNSLLLGRQAFEAASDEDGRKVSDIDTAAEYYARVRAVQRSGAETKYSDWAYSENVGGERRSGLDVLRRNGEPLELRSAIGEDAGGYSVVQGSASDGQFIYCALHASAMSGQTRIAKMDAASMDVVGVSEPLRIGHANDLAYDARRGQLAAVHLDGGQSLAVSYIDRESLQVVETRDVVVPEEVAGASPEQRGEVLGGIQALAYQPETGHYFALIPTHNVVELDENLCTVRYIVLSEHSPQTSQGMEVAGDRILIVFSASKGGGNIVQSFEMDGRFLSQTVLECGSEAESCFVIGNQLYATFYGGAGTRTCYIYRVERF